eukprot:4562873-Amphidinium_carterae.1
MPCGIGPPSCDRAAKVLELPSDFLLACIRSKLVWQPPCLVSVLLRRTLHGGGSAGYLLNWG